MLHLPVGASFSLSPRRTQHLGFASSLLPALRPQTWQWLRAGEPRWGEPASPWSLVAEGAGAGGGAVLREQVTMGWILLRRCWGARCPPGRESPSSLQRGRRQQLRGWLATVPLAPAARSAALCLAEDSSVSLPPGSTARSAWAAQQEQLLGREVLWWRTDLS